MAPYSRERQRRAIMTATSSHLNIRKVRAVLFIMTRAPPPNRPSSGDETMSSPSVLSTGRHDRPDRRFVIVRPASPALAREDLQLSPVRIWSLTNEPGAVRSGEYAFALRLNPVRPKAASSRAASA
jgi:hypothetical protein